jgi:hypothetical protein
MRTSKSLLSIAVTFAVFFMCRADGVAEVLFHDDFEADTIGQEPQKWEYDPGAEIKDIGQVFTDPLDPNNQVLTDYGGYLADNGAEYTDFVAEWDWMFYENNNRNNSVGFHVQDPTAHYQLSRRSGGNDWNIYMFNGSWNLIVSEPFPTEIDTWYRVQLSVMGDEFLVKVKEKEDATPFKDLAPVLEVSDATYESGHFSTSYWGPIDNVIIADTEEDIIAFLTGGVTPLRAGDADRDFDFDQLDLVKVQIAAKYLTGQAATWGEGDWNGAPGGSQQQPPSGDGTFNQLDIIAALNAATYLKGPYAAIQGGGQRNDAQTSVGYNAGTGELFVDAPAGIQLTSINIDSAGRIFTGAPAQNLGGSFDNDADGNIFKATFGSSFGSLSFGNVAQSGLSESSLLNDLTVVGSLAGGGALGNVDLIYIPEPSTLILLAMGLVAILFKGSPRWLTLGRVSCAVLVVGFCLVVADSASATKVLFHGREIEPTFGDDGAVFDHLVAKYGGDNVTYLMGLDAAPDGSSADGFDVVIVSSSMPSSALRGKYEDSPVGIVNWENALIHDNDLGNFMLSDASGNENESSTLTQIDIVDPSHPLAAGLSGTVTVYSAANWHQYGLGPLGAGVSLIASSTQIPDRHAIFAADVGGTLLGDGSDGSPATAAGRRVMFFLSDVGFSTLTNEGRSLFNAAVDWAAGVVEPSKNEITLDVTALVDGRDQLIIRGNTLQWHHLQFAAVGRHEGRNEPTTISTTLNGNPVLTGFEWTPDWSVEPPDQVRFEDFSSIFEGLSPAIPVGQDLDVTLEVIDGRSIVDVVQLPTADNDFTTILEINDNGPGGSAFYQAQLTFSFAGGVALQAGDADQDKDFDQLDLVKVLGAAKYLTGQGATWGEGDWDGAPGGSPGNPPRGNGLFDQLDIIKALSAGHYLKGPYAAIRMGGTRGDGQTSVIYDARSGEVAVDAPAGQQLTSINIDSAAAIFTGAPAQNLGGSFDNDADANIFKATFGTSFGSLSFGNVAQSGLSEAFVLNDLNVVGSLAGGGALGDVDLIYVPEPPAMVLAAMALVVVSACRRGRK